MKKQEIALIKSFMALQENLTNEKQKLSDKYHDLELSHNRKIRALEKIKSTLEIYTFMPLDYQIKLKLLKYCEDALFCNGRERTKICGNN